MLVNHHKLTPPSAIQDSQNYPETVPTTIESLKTFIADAVDVSSDPSGVVQALISRWANVSRPPHSGQQNLRDLPNERLVCWIRAGTK